VILLSPFFSDGQNIANSWILSTATLSSCPDNSGQFLLSATDENCVETDIGLQCHEFYMSFESDGDFSIRVETMHEDSGEHYTSFSYIGRYTIGSDEVLTTCDPDMRACEEMTYHIDGDQLIISDFLGCAGTMTFDRVREDRN
jgi:hypothetical protein